MRHRSQTLLAAFLLVGMAGGAQTQATPAKTKTKPSAKMAARSTAGKKPVAPAVSAEDIRALRDAIAAQQQQIQALQQQLQTRATQESATAQSLRQVQSSASEASNRAAAAESAATQTSDSVTKLQTDLTDVKQNQTNAALTTQDDQKKLSSVESALGRFRFTGDVRVRQETFLGSGSGGCFDAANAGCTPRVRERIRLRLGLEGKLGEDFVGGIFLASGVLNDPTSTNQTLDNFFERKQVGFDRGYITYAPQAHKWLQVTAGKFAYTWQRTSVTFDPDLNPEGFSEKFSFDVKHPVVKNFTLTGLQLFWNENNPVRQPSSFTVGGQASSRLQFFGDKWTLTPSYTLLNFRNVDSIFRAAPANGGNSLTTGNIIQPNSTVGVFAPNGFTNSETFTGVCPASPVVTNAPNPAGGNFSCVGHFGSQFLYSDFIVNSVVKTKYAKLPWNLLLEYADNLNASPLAGGTGNGRHAYYGETGLGQTKNKGDYQFGYAFLRQEQDSVISSFDESDNRAPTNVLQHRFFFQYKIQKNTALGYTQWIGRTLNSNLQNAALGPGAPATARPREPFLSRFQFDVVYSF